MVVDPSGDGELGEVQDEENELREDVFRRGEEGSEEEEGGGGWRGELGKEGIDIEVEGWIAAANSRKEEIK